ncbi:MAG: hypothetical protein QM569_14940, partial [Acidovorax sp.]
MAVDLLFRRAPATSGVLVFGDDDSASIGVATLGLAVALPGLGGMRLLVGVGLGLSATLPGLGGQVGLKYNSGTARPLVGRVRSAWQAAEALPHGLGARW